MTLDALNNFEWHDLPLESLTFTESSVELVVTPYNEAAKAYQRFRLVIEGAADLRLDVRGQLSPKDRASLEVSRFDFREVGDRLSGELGILPGSAGFWKIGFTDAHWTLERLPDEQVRSVGR